MKAKHFLLAVTLMFGTICAKAQMSTTQFDASVGSLTSSLQLDAQAMKDFRTGITAAGMPHTMAVSKYTQPATMYFGEVKFQNRKAAKDTTMSVLCAKLDVLAPNDPSLKGKMVPFMAIDSRTNSPFYITGFDQKKPSQQPAATNAPGQQSLAQTQTPQTASTATTGGATPTTQTTPPQGTTPGNNLVNIPVGTIIPGSNGSNFVVALVNGQPQLVQLQQAPAPVVAAPIDSTMKTATYAMSVSTTGDPNLLKQPAPGAATAQTTPASATTNLPSGSPSQIRNSDGSIGILQADGTYKTFVDPTTVSAAKGGSAASAFDPNDPNQAVAVVQTAAGQETMINTASNYRLRDKVSTMKVKRTDQVVTEYGDGTVSNSQERATTHLGIRHGTDNELNPTEATNIKFNNQGSRIVAGCGSCGSNNCGGGCGRRSGGLERSRGLTRGVSHGVIIH